ncbi:outer membrane beta-barrel protein [Chitinophaga sp. 22321]|uniref:TonB-dependent receptor family protein n=1 Tax=Chitinophaga hostae TaxID=2831022 RepID=A0ABS5J1I3_9BACT|nr:outer membrane beta-barrel family protein [Chitinophaga hostae]MBS0029060.1 TonB-dependent receptor family protein [Chitinophaga hostae]
MKKCYLLLIACWLSFAAYAQKNGSIKGSLLDTAAHHPVVSATVTLLKAKDSSLVTFTMTNNKGAFELSGVPPGDYRLLFTHVSYHNNRRLVTIPAGSADVQLPAVIMHDLSRTLDEVVVTGESPPVTLIGDTIQYNAGSFKTIPNASVEQLLKKMPGIQVNKDGTVKAQGQTVKRVLVDGKEFFGTDPKIATKNLPADAVDKVQVYDRLSDAAQLTGFDDGNSEKTINLKLKQDKKKGMFGKATAGAGTSDRYEGRFNINSFKGARQLSVIGMANNTNAEGFSFMDMMSFSGELNRMRQSGNASFALSSVDPMGALAGGGNSDGFKDIWGGGINYNNIIGKKTAFSSSYFYNHYNPHQESNLQRQYFLPDSTYSYQQQAQSSNLNNTHRANISADIQLDSSQSLKITSSIGYQENNSNSATNYKTLTGTQELANEGASINQSSGKGSNVSADILYRKKFRRPGNTFSLGLQTSFNNTESNGSLLSANHFYLHNGSQPEYDSIHQRNTVSGNLKSYNARAVYTVPLLKHSLLELSMSRSNSSNTADKVTYDYNRQNGKFDQLNPLLSNNFENTYGYTNAGFRWRTKQKKFSIAAGLNWQQAALEGKIIAGTKDSVIGKTFYNLLPSMRFKYDFTRYRNLSINYATVTNQPSMSQLQPVPDISDPLNIQEGNPYLKQEFTHAVQLSFISVDPFRNKNLFAFFNLQETQHKIVNNDVVDSLGIKHTRPVNINGAYNMTGSVNWSLPLHVWSGAINFSSNMGYGSTQQFINTAANTIRTLTFGPAVRADLNPSEKLDLSISAGINYYKTDYSLKSALNTDYFSQQYEGSINWQLPANFYFSGSLVYIINSKRANGYNNSIPLCNASLSKQFLHFNRGELKLSVSDLFNENVGISRSTNQNYIEDSRTTNLQRFFLLSFTYSLNKTGLSAGGRAHKIMMR